MLVEKSVKEVLLRLHEVGCQGSIVSVQRIHDLKEEVVGRSSEGAFDQEFYRERLSWFDFRIPESLPTAKSLIIIAIPRPQGQATFTLNGETRALILPPTYVAYTRTTKQMEDFLAGILGKWGFHVAPTALPLKPLAVRSGLAEYGRNNICYIPGMGSFLQLVAVYSDLPCTEDSWREPRMMKRCLHCQACRKACPTGAISADRFLLHAERCIVFHGEKKGDVPFPPWINPSWHNCLYGCLHCQRACPEDTKFLRWIVEKAEFSEKETAMLLRGITRDQLPAETVKKLEYLDLMDSLDSLPRNISVFFGENKH